VSIQAQNGRKIADIMLFITF